MNKLLALLLVLTLVLTFSACGGGTEGGDDAITQVTIGVVIPVATHNFTSESVSHVKAEAAKLMAERKGLEIIIKTGLEATNQISEIENLLANYELDVIMLWPLEGEALRSAAQSILDAGVELVIYDRLIADFDGIVGEVMGDNEGIGTMMGNYLTTYFAEDDQVNYLRFIGDASTVGVQRSAGMDGVLDPAKFVQNGETIIGGWSAEKSQTELENWLAGRSIEEIEALDLIVTHDDEMVDGVMNALESYAGEAKINVKLITSVGGREETLQKFEATKYKDLKLATFFFAPQFIRSSLQLTVAHAYGEEYPIAVAENGQYLIPSFAISNAGGESKTFEEYRNDPIYTERYSIFE